MRDKLIEFETAKLAKEKKFDIYTNICWYKGIESDSEFYQTAEFIDIIYKPTQSLLQKWLREVHYINVYCTPCQHDENLWYNNIASHNPVFTEKYEEALEIGLQKALKLL